jgi:hypothetical protein
MITRQTLVNRANTIQRLLDSGTDSDLHEAAKLACETLKDLYEEKSFWEAMESAESGLSSDDSRQIAVRELLTDFDSLNDFLNVERQILLRIGLSEHFVSNIINDILRERDILVKEFTLRDKDFKFIMNRVSAAQVSICQASDSLQKDGELVQRRRHHRRTARRALTFICAVIVYVSNKTEAVKVIFGVPIPKEFADASEFIAGYLIDRSA